MRALLFFLHAAFMTATTMVAWSQATAEELLQKAEVWSFYSGNTLHSKYECLQATDSVSAWLTQLSSDDSLARQRMGRILEELEIGADNSSDNLNGIYPAFGGMTGQRLDYLIIDDPDEALAEELVSQFLNMPSQSRKGKYKDSGVFMIVTTDSCELEMVNVLMDLLNAESSAYVLRPHELKGVVPCDIEDASCLQSLSAKDWRRILDSYNTKDLLLLTLKQKTEISDDISYMGLHVQRFTRGDEALTFENYVEGFKTNKILARTKASLLIVLGFVLSFLTLTLVGVLDYSEGRFLFVDDWKTKLHAQKNVTSLTVSMVVVALTFYAGSQVAPGLNEYHRQPKAILWLLGMVAIPPLSAVIATYVLMWKFMKKWSVNNMADYSRMIQAGFLATYVWMFYWNSISHPDDQLSTRIGLLLFAGVFTLSPSWVMGHSLFQLTGGGAKRGKVVMTAGVALLSWGLIAWSMVFAYADEHRTSDAFHIGGFLLAVGYLWILPKILRKPVYSVERSESYGIHQPVQDLETGLNWGEVRRSMTAWMNTPDSTPVCIVKGKTGSGKTRLIRSWQNSENARDDKTLVLLGDFGAISAEDAKDFEPFVEAVYSGGSRLEQQDWLSVFKDMTHLASSLSEAAERSAALMGISFPESEVDESRGVFDVASSFLAMAEKKRKNGTNLVLVLDNYSWSTSDEKSRKLLLEIVERLDQLNHTKRPLKVVLVFDESSINETTNNQLLEELKKAVKDPIWGSSMEQLGWNASSPDVLKTSISEWVDALGEEVQWEEGRRLKMAKKLREHLKNKALDLVPNDKEGLQAIIRRTPSTGDFLSYLGRLQDEGFIGVQGEEITLVKNPDSIKIPLDQGMVAEIAGRFNALTDDDQKLLVSAAHIGFRFDAQLLAEIWKMDLLRVLAALDSPNVEQVFVIDQSSDDNVYSFVNRDVHQRLKEGFDLEESSRVRQMMVEFQKRALRHIYAQGDKYLMSVDLEVLNATAVDCINYVDVEFIQEFTSKTLLVAAYRNFTSGKTNAGEVYMQSWVKLVLLRKQVPLETGLGDDISSDMTWLALILDHLNESDRSLDLVLGDGAKTPERKGVRGLLRLLLQRQCADGRQDGGRVYLALIDEARCKLGTRRQDDAPHAYQQICDWYDELVAKWPYQDVGLQLEFDFLESLGREQKDAKQHDESSAIEKLVNTLNGFEQLDDRLIVLKGKALRNLANRPKSTRSEAFLLRAIEHQLDVMHMRDMGEVVTLESIFDSLENLHEVLGTRRHKEGANYCFLLGAAANQIAQTPEGKTKLSQWMIEAGERHHMKFTRNRGLSLKAQRLIELKRFDEALKTLLLYGRLLLKEGADATDFKFPLKGLLELGQSNGEDYSGYFKMMSEMYESLRIVSKRLKMDLGKMLDKSPEYLDDLEALSSSKLLGSFSEEDPQSQRGTTEMHVVNHLLDLLARIAISDGELTDDEIHDLGEMALAICLHMHLDSSEEVVATMNGNLLQWKKESENDREGFLESNKRGFKQVAQQIDNECSNTEKRQILRLCNLVATSDGEIDLAERELLGIAKASILVANGYEVSPV